jgi:hypothetical protein
MSVVTLIILLVGGGVAYVFFSGEYKAPQNSSATQKPVDQQRGLPKPSTPNPKAPVGAAVQSLLSPVKAGSNTSITVKSNAGSKCKISVSYGDILSKDSGLAPKVADAYGNVTWSWTVERSAPAGTWPVKVTCVFYKKSAFVQGDLKVIK